MLEHKPVMSAKPIFYGLFAVFLMISLAVLFVNFPTTATIISGSVAVAATIVKVFDL